MLQYRVYSVVHHTCHSVSLFFFFFQAEDGIRDLTVTGVQTCALPISWRDQAHVGREVGPWSRPRSPDPASSGRPRATTAPSAAPAGNQQGSHRGAGPLPAAWLPRSPGVQRRAIRAALVRKGVSLGAVREARAL